MSQTSALSAPYKPGRLDTFLTSATSWLPPLLAAVGLIALWQLIIWAFQVPSYIAPEPLAVLQAFRENAWLLWRNFLPTFVEAMLGFLVGNLVAILLAIWFVHNSLAERAFYPIAVFIKTVPILAVAPILVLIFGNGYSPKIIIAALICFFPTLVNMVRGLKAVSPATLELMRILSASDLETFRKVRIQSSLPFLFAALKIASSSCVIGAMVGEWVGSNFGLGALIIETTLNYRSPLLYAVVFTSAGLAVVMFAIVSLAERQLINWKTPEVH